MKHMKLNLKFGAVFQAIRERAGLSQEELAALLHRTQPCISKYERDKKVPDFNTVLQWADLTNAREVVVAFIYGMDGVSILQNLARLAGG